MSPHTHAAAEVTQHTSDRETLLASLPVTDRRLEIGGVSTAVLEGGNGPPFVLLHGPGEFAARWMRIIPSLVARYRVIAPDLPDHGASKVLRGQLDGDLVAGWLEALIGRTCTEPPILLGHLLGGSIAARFAGSRPNAIRHLILVDSFGLHPFRPSPRFAIALMRFITRPSDKSYDRFMRHCLVDPERVEGELAGLWDALRRYSLNRTRSPRVKAAMRALMKSVGVPPIPKEDLAAIEAPTTLIWGRQDRALPLKIARAASARYGWPLHVIENAADDPPMEQPEAMLEAMEAALERYTH
jgi:pimeloyl-ACP methyl ester carboxylesterase